MRLLLLSTEFPPGPGGIGTHAHQLALGLRERGWEVAVLTRQAYAAREEIEAFNREQPMTVEALPGAGVAPLTAVAGYRVVSRRTREWKPDLVVASGDRVIYLTAWVARRRALPWVAVEHGRSPRGWERRLKRWALAEATGVVCVSRHTWTRMTAMGVEPRTGCVIENGADPGRFRVLPDDEKRAFRESLGLDGARLLLTVGNVSERKGQDLVIRALPRILERAPNTHYLMAGLPTRRREFHAIAEDLGVARRVHFLGRVEPDRLVRLLNAADVFAMTSRQADDQFEGYGIAVAEAALCGLPSVVTSGSGLSEAIQAGETGLAASEEDAAAVAEAVLGLLGDEDRRRAMGAAARRRALAAQTWSRRAEEYDGFFRSLL